MKQHSIWHLVHACVARPIDVWSTKRSATVVLRRCSKINIDRIAVQGGGVAGIPGTAASAVPPTPGVLPTIIAQPLTDSPVTPPALAA